jgi:hypothetical protein
MPYFKKNEINDINLLFIHIPKTGGSSLEIYFSRKYGIGLNYNSLYSGNNAFNGHSLQHSTLREIKEMKIREMKNIDFNNIKIISIVRNPYHRLISDFFYHKFLNQNSDKDFVYKKIKEYFENDNTYDNHKIPQYQFLINDDNNIDKDVIILRTENLNEDMKNLGYDDFNIREKKNRYNNINYMDYLNNESIQLINDYYDMDFIYFNYEKIIP